MLEPLAVTVHAVKRFSPVKGAKAAVLGCGPIGILLIQSLKTLGAAEVFATDVSDYRLKLAAELGADYTVNTKGKDFSEEFLKAFGPDKADVIVERFIRSPCRSTQTILIREPVSSVPSATR